MATMYLAASALPPHQLLAAATLPTKAAISSLLSPQQLLAAAPLLPQ